MTPFAISAPTRILFGRGEAARAHALIRGLGARILIVHGNNSARADWLIRGLAGAGAEMQMYACGGEPTLAMLTHALRHTTGFEPEVVVGLGGGAVLDLAKALAALIPSPTGVLDHLEIVGRGLPLTVPPLPFVAIPTTAGTGAEATKNAVIGLPDHGRKVSLRDDRMVARLAIIDPALTDNCPRAITLASGLDAITQVIEPYLSRRATLYTDALTRPAIAEGTTALIRLMQAEDAAARDQMAWVSLRGGLALANGGLGAVHGLAGVIGGMTGAPHGALCGVLLGPVLAMHRQTLPATSPAAARLAEVNAIIATAFGTATVDALSAWAKSCGLPNLVQMGLQTSAHSEVAKASLSSSSMQGNPVLPSTADLVQVLQQASI